MIKASLFFLLTLNFAFAKKKLYDYTDVINGIDNGLTYILKHPYSFNVDGLFGITFAIANLEAIRKHGYKDKQLENLLAKAEQLYQTIYPLLKTEGSDELFRQELLRPELLDEHINFVVDAFDVDHTTDPIETYSDLLKYYRRVESNETAIDICFVELLKSPGPACPIGNRCHIFMINGTPQDAGYVISHRLLYLIIARMRRCTIDDPIWYDNMIEFYCGRMMFEVETMANFNYPQELQDLFLEHVTLCGYSGYADFLRPEYADAALEMQSPEGCFSPMPQKRRRTKRKSNMDRQGCYDHTNGLGISTLSMYLRYELINS